MTDTRRRRRRRRRNGRRRIAVLVCCAAVLAGAGFFLLRGTGQKEETILSENGTIYQEAADLAASGDQYTLRLSGIQKMDEGDYAGAIVDFEAALLAAKGWVGDFETDVLKYRAEAEYMAEDYAAAAHTYEILIRLDGEQGEYLYREALCLALAGDAEGSLAAYQQGILLKEKEEELSVGRSDVLAAVGKALTDAGRAQEAEAIYQEAIQDGSAGPSVFNRMGMGFMETGQYSQALECFQQAISAGKTAGQENADGESQALKQASFNRAAALEYLERYDEALTAFREYVSAYGSDEDAQKEILFLETR